MAKIQRTAFICVHEREPESGRECCASKDSMAVLKAFKTAVGDHNLKRVFRPIRSGCLDQCAKGTTVVVYPDDVWYGGVTPEDVPEIVERHVLRGEVVERLVIPDERMTGVPRERRALPPLAKKETRG